MSKIPSMTGFSLIKALKKLGFEVIRKKGSHHFLRHPDVHRGEVIGKGLFMQILRDCEITRDDLQKGAS